MRTIELLAPAKNLSCAIAAINAGADAVYIGGPSYGARVNASNSLDDIKKLCDYAHLFGVKIHVTINTILNDKEIEFARDLSFKLYDIGVDALIIQDLGLINGELPPLEIHASTQQDNSSVEKVQFLEKAGFSQVVLARELSISQIRQIHENTNVKLEAFVHGALCVGVSGRCYLSYALTKRSANRGECSQLCRVPQTLTDVKGNILAKDKYLLSMKDLNQSKNLEEMIDAGISSFKIEGRLKDENYVKNVTAYYRKKLDKIIEKRSDLKRSSFGESELLFTPDVNKSFNRSFTEYNTHEKKENYANFDAPGFVGVEIGKLISQKGNNLTFALKKKVSLNNGDSINYYNSKGNLEGFRIGKVKDQNTAEIFQDIEKIKSGTLFYRNKDAEFERVLLDPKSAIRKLKLTLEYSESTDGIMLSGTDESGFSQKVEAKLDQVQKANDVNKLKNNIESKLGRLGDSIYSLSQLSINLSYCHFVPQSVLNNLRRELIERLYNQKLNIKKNIIHDFSKAPDIPEKEKSLGFKANIYNQKAKDFYISHGCNTVVDAYEKIYPGNNECVLVSKHCLRFCFNMCPKKHHVKAQDLFLQIGSDKFKLEFDCKNCLMKLIGPMSD